MKGLERLLDGLQNTERGSRAGVQEEHVGIHAVRVLLGEDAAAGLGGGATMGQKMVLIGIAVSAMLSSVNDYLITRGDLEKAEAAKTWQHGSLNAISWGQMEVQSIILVIAIPLILMLTRRLRTLELGDDLAAGLGLPVKRSVNLLVAAGCLSVRCPVAR